MKDLKLIVLIDKYQQGNCTPAEKLIVEEWMNSLAIEENAFEEINEKKNWLSNKECLITDCP